MQVVLGTWDTRYPLRSELLSRTALKTANYTAAAGELVQFDLSGASANVTMTLPLTPTAGQQVGAQLLIGHATWNLVVALNSKPFRGGTSDIRCFDLCLAGDTVVFEYVDGTTGWVPVLDRLRPHRAQIKRSAGAAAQAVTVNGGLTTIQFDTNERQVGLGVDLSAESITPRRKGIYEFIAQAQLTALADQSRVQAFLNGPTDTIAFPEQFISYGTTIADHVGGTQEYLVDAGTAVTFRVQVVHNAGTGTPAMGAGTRLLAREMRD